jgi:hypothetical protein
MVWFLLNMRMRYWIIFATLVALPLPGTLPAQKLNFDIGTHPTQSLVLQQVLLAFLYRLQNALSLVLLPKPKPSE